MPSKLYLTHLEMQVVMEALDLERVEMGEVLVMVGWVEEGSGVEGWEVGEEAWGKAVSVMGVKEVEMKVGGKATMAWADWRGEVRGQLGWGERRAEAGAVPGWTLHKQ